MSWKDYNLETKVHFKKWLKNAIDKKVILLTDKLIAPNEIYSLISFI